MTKIRDPFWLTKTERTALAEAIIDLCQQTAVLPRLQEHLDAVLTELGVAEARDHVWPEKSEIVRRAHGYSADTLPIRMSEEELRAVLGIPTMPPDLTMRLSGTPEKK